MKNISEGFQKLREIRDCAFATVDQKGNPQNRIIDVMLAEENRIIFCTARGKNFYQELCHNPRVSVVGMGADFVMVRLDGTVTKLEESKQWMDKIFEANPNMNEVYPGEARYILEPFAIEQGAIEMFDLSKTPIERCRIAFGNNEEVETKEYEISDACIGCQRCVLQCPQKAMTMNEGKAVIAQNHCLHCGYCKEVCPVNAIDHRVL